MECRTCLHWEDRNLRSKRGVCSKAEYSDKIYISVGVNDDSGLNTELFTSPDFGCVLYEEGKPFTKEEGH